MDEHIIEVERMEPLFASEHDFTELKNIGYNNFWYYYEGADIEKYIKGFRIQRRRR